MNRTDSQFVYDVSIVIPTKNRHESMLHTLGALLSQIPNHKNIEIIIIEETNDPLPVKQETVKYYSIPKNGLGFGFVRNLGLKKSTGEIVAFIDDDVIPANNWFESLITPFEDEKVGAVGGAILPDLSEINTVGKCISFLGFPAGGLKRYIEANGRDHETNLISTGNCAFRAILARQIGGFDVFLRWGGEDQDFFSRMSLLSKTVYVPDAIVFHRQRNSLRNVLKWFTRRGTGEFFIRCTRSRPLSSLISPLRRSFFLKLCVFLIACLVALHLSTLLMFSFVSVTIIVWNRLLWQREYKVLHKEPDNDQMDSLIKQIWKAITTKDVKRMLFLVKLTMDVGHEIGLLIGLMRYLNYRIFSKPFILTFHHFGDPEGGIPPDNAKYYYPKDKFWKILEDSESNGRLVVSLSEIIRRLKENPITLYFSKLLCITFDDASLSIYEPTKQLSAKRDCPFTVFLATGLIGGANKWDTPKGFRQDKIMSWEQINDLSLDGVQIGSHTRHHVHLLEVSRDDKIKEISESMGDLRRNLSHHLDKEVFFSYPFGEYDREVIQLVKQAGYAGAVANFQGNIRPKTDPWQIPRFSVTPDSDWASLSIRSRSLWFKELLKDVRHKLF